MLRIMGTQIKTTFHWVHPVEIKSVCQRDICIPMLLPCLRQFMHSSQEMDTTPESIIWRTNKENVTASCLKQYSAIKWMKFCYLHQYGWNTMLSEISQKQKDKYINISLRCGICKSRSHWSGDDGGYQRQRRTGGREDDPKIDQYFLIYSSDA
jgi:hypothetical protein